MFIMRSCRFLLFFVILWSDNPWWTRPAAAARLLLNANCHFIYYTRAKHISCERTTNTYDVLYMWQYRLADRLIDHTKHMTVGYNDSCRQHSVRRSISRSKWPLLAWRATKNAAALMCCTAGATHVEESTTRLSADYVKSVTTVFKRSITLQSGNKQQLRDELFLWCLFT